MVKSFTQSRVFSVLKRQRLLFAFLSLLLFALEGRAQVSLTATSGTGTGSFTTLKAAFDAINAGTHQGAIVISISANTTESAPCVLNSSGAGSASYTSVLVRPTSDGVTVSGSTATGRGLVELNGADNITIDGDNPNTGGTNKNLTITNTATNTITYNSVIRIACGTAAPYLDNNNIAIKNLILNGSATGRNGSGFTSTTASENTTFGIIVGPNGAATPTAITSITTAINASATVNSFQVDNNTINRVARGVVFLGNSATSSNSVTITNNTIGDQTALSGSAPYTSPSTTVYTKGIFVRGMTSLTISGNTIKNIISYVGTAKSAIELSTAVGTGVGTVAINNNIIEGIVSNGTSAADAILVSASAVQASVSGNSVKNVQTVGAASASGITLSNSSSSVPSVTLNKNKITQIYALNTGAYAARGILVSSGNNYVITNNWISDLLAVNDNSTTSTSFAVKGISLASGTGHKVYHNSVVLRGTFFGTLTTPDNTTCLMIGAASQTGIDIRNNLFENTIVNNAAVANACLQLPLGATSTMNLTLNNNAYYTGSSSNNYLLITLSTFNSYTTTNFNSGSTSPATNARSYTSTLSSAGTNDNASFAFTTTAPVVSATDLHLSTSSPTVLESGGASVGITEDIDGDVRPGPVGSANGGGTVADIGSDEFDGIPSDVTPPIISFTPLATTCLTASRTLTATISDASGVPTTGGDLPVLYWKVNGGAYSSSQGVHVTGNSFEFSFGGGVSSLDTVSYYIVAQDNAGNVGAFPSTGASGLSISPPTAAIAPTNPSSYVIGQNLSGTYTVGSGGNYATLTAAVAAYNGNCLSGPVVFSLTDATYSSAETFPITINENSFASLTNTLTIVPATGVNATVTSSIASPLFILNGSDYVIFEGSNNSSSSRNLTLYNSSASSPTLIQMRSLGANAGATNNTVKNTILRTAVNSTTGYGIAIGGSTLGTSGSDNDNNTIQNNLIEEPVIGIYAIGDAANSSTGMDNLVVSQNTITANGTLTGYMAMRIGNALSADINRNTISIQTSGASLCGISLETGFINSSVTRNLISKVQTTNTSSIPVVRGISIATGSGSSNVTIANNVISNVISFYATTNLGSNPCGILVGASGINTTYTNLTGGVNIDYNSINMFGTVDRNSACLNFGVFFGSNVNSINFRNNVVSNAIINGNTSAGASKSYAIYSQSANTAFAAIDNNCFYVSGAQGVLGFLGSDAAAITDIRSLFGQNLNSINSNPLFNSNTNLRPIFGSPLLGAGVPIVGLSVDYLGGSRSATAPSIGAYESGADATAPVISYSGIANTQSTSNQTVSATITDSGIGASGVDISTSNKPAIYFRKHSDANAFGVANNSTGNGWKYKQTTSTTSPFSLEIDGSLLQSAPTTGDTIFYFVVAQDSAGNIAAETSAGFAATSVTSVTAAPTTLSRYIIVGPPLAGTYTVGTGGNFTTITEAVNNLNLRGVSAAVVFELTDALYSTGETFPIVLSNYTGISASNTVTILPAAANSAAEISGTNATAIFSFDNGDYYTLDGRPGGTGSTSALTISNANTSAPTIRFINDASNNVVKFAAIKGASTSSTSGVVVFGTTTQTDGNDANTISNNSISNSTGGNPYNLIYSAGTAAKTNSGNTISDNNLFDFFNASGANAIAISSNSTGFSITGNSIYQSATRTVGGTFRGISIDNTSGSNFTVSNNYIGGSAPLAAGTAMTFASAATVFQGIYINADTSVASSVQGNTIQNINITTTSTSTVQGLIYLNAGRFNVGTITANTLGSTSASGSILISTTGSTGTFAAIGLGTSNFAEVNISNNQIGGIEFSGTGNMSLRGIDLAGSTGRFNVSNNLIGSTTIANSLSQGTNNSLIGIINRNSSATQPIVISNNTIANGTITLATGAATIRGITSGTPNLQITNNTIYNLSSNNATTSTGQSSAVIGIIHSATGTNGQTCSGNTIHSLSSTAAAAVSVIGIHANTATSGTNVFHKNNIHSLSATNASSRVIGIEMAGGNANYYNNFIRLGIDAAGSAVTSSVRFFGFNETAGTNNIYFNSVYIGGTGVSTGNDSTLAFTSSVTGVTREIRNNYFYNERTNGSGTGIHYAIQVGGTSINPTGLTLNNNNYYVSGSSLGRYNSLSVADLTAWKAAVGQDGGSISENVPFVNATGTASTVDLHIVAATQTGMESGGANISGISVDFDGDDRPGPASSTNGGATSSDIGADEFDGTPAYTCSNPVAGAAVASTATGCISLSSTTLSLTGAVLDGTGNTYQWESSTNGSTFTPVAGANSATLVATSIAQTTYYRCVITCANGPISSTSDADTVAITAPVVSSTTPATRCGTGTVTLQASGSGSGFGDLKWYASASGGTAIGTGSSFTTPSISSTTNYYVSAVAAGSSTFSAGKAAREPSSTATNLTTYGQLFTITEQITLNSVKVESTTGTAITVTLLNSAGTTQLQTTGSQTVPTSAISTINLGWVIPAGTYRLAVTGMTGSFYRDNTNATYPMAIGSIGSITGFFSSLTGSNTTTASYYFLYDWSVSVGCESARTMVTATVTAPPALTTNMASSTICEGSSTGSPITISSNVADYDSYAWTPSSSVSGNSSIGFTFNPTSTTNYTLSANNTTSGCSNTASVTINVNPRPTLVSTTPSNPGVCSGVVQSLTVSGGTIGGQGTIGSATTLSTATTQPTAFCNRWSQYWMQMVYTAAELQAAGLTAGTINSVAFNITTLGDASNVTNMRVALGTTSSSTLSAWQTTGLTQVYGPSTYNHAIGWNTITFTTPFVWDGVSNILLDVRHDGVDMTNNAQTYYTATSGNTVLTATTSTTSSTSDLASTNPTPTTSVNRLNTRFEISSPVSYVWSPSTDLYTDALASSAYTNTNASTLYVKPTSSRTYTITATNPSTGCFRTGDVNVTMLTAPSAPSAPTLVSATSGSLDISWTAVANATDYRLDVATDAGFTSFVSGYNNKTIASTTETVGGLSVGTTYYVRLRASNSCGASSNSTTLTTITLSSAPVLANASAVSATGMTINWNASTGAASYKLDLATDNAFTSFVSGYQDLTVSGTSQAVTGLTAATRYYYRVRAVNASGTSGNSLTGDTITLSGTVGLTLTAILEGFYLAIDDSMTSPVYNSDNSMPSNIADTIVVQLHHATTFDSLFAWRGPISTLGVASASFPGAVNGNSYYIVIKHRNSLETWSANPVSFGSSASYNFTTSASQAYGGNMISLGNGKFGIYAGDLNQDGYIDGNDFTDVDNDNANFASGYLYTDVNGDGYVDGNDFTSIDNNGSNFIGLARP